MINEPTIVSPDGKVTITGEALEQMEWRLGSRYSEDWPKASWQERELIVAVCLAIALNWSPEYCEEMAGNVYFVSAAGAIARRYELIRIGSLS